MSMTIAGITVYTAEDVAEMFSMHIRTVRRHFADGNICGKKIGHSWVVTEENLRRFVSPEDKE